MKTMLEVLAEKALAAHRESLEEDKHSLEAREAALALVKASPLAEKMFPHVSWRLVDHNLHLVEPQQQVIVEADDEVEPDFPIRFVVARSGGLAGAQYAVGLVPPSYTSKPWYDERTVIVRNVVDVAEWLEEQRKVAAADAAFEQAVTNVRGSS